MAKFRYLAALQYCGSDGLFVEQANKTGSLTASESIGDL
jgi:hypothetical protein